MLVVALLVVALLVVSDEGVIREVFFAVGRRPWALGVLKLPKLQQYTVTTKYVAIVPNRKLCPTQSQIREERGLNLSTRV